MLMTCRHFQQWREAFLDRELNESQNAAMHAHLLQCPECQRQVAIARACEDVITMDPRGPRLSAGFADRVTAALPARAAAVTPARRRWLNTRRWLEYGPLPAVAAMLAFAVILRPPAGQPELPVGPGIVAGAQDTFLSTLEKDAGVKEVVSEALESCGHVTEGARDFIDMCEKKIDDAHAKLVERTKQNDSGSPFMFDLLIQPFIEMMDPETDTPSTSDEIERF